MIDDNDSSINYNNNIKGNIIISQSLVMLYIQYF